MVLASLLGLLGCGDDPAARLPTPGTELADPPAAARAGIEQAVARWSKGRFTPGEPRWFRLADGAPPVAAMKSVDNALAGKATRITETGPDGTDATMQGWKLARESGGHNGIVVAVSKSDPTIGALIPVKLAQGWPD